MLSGHTKKLREPDSKNRSQGKLPGDDVRQHGWGVISDMHSLPISGGPGGTESQVTPRTNLLPEDTWLSGSALHPSPPSFLGLLSVCLSHEDLLFCSCLRLSNFMPGNSILSVFKGKIPESSLTFSSLILTDIPQYALWGFILHPI